MKLVQCLGSGFAQNGSWLVEPPRPAKALMYRRNPCFSRSREVCPAASATGSMPDNPQLPFVDWRSATETTTQRTDWNRPGGSLFSCGLLGTQKYLIGIIVTVKYTPDGIAIFRVIRIIAHRCLGLLHKPVSRFILGRNWDDVDVAAPTTETLEIPDFGFTAFADEVYDRIPLSVSGGSAADFLYSSHVAFPPMNGIAPYRPCRYPLAMFSPFRGEKSVKA